MKIHYNAKNNARVGFKIIIRHIQLFIDQKKKKLPTINKEKTNYPIKHWGKGKGIKVFNKLEKLLSLTHIQGNINESKRRYYLFHCQIGRIKNDEFQWWQEEMW